MSAITELLDRLPEEAVLRFEENVRTYRPNFARVYDPDTETCCFMGNLVLPEQRAFVKGKHWIDAEDYDRFFGFSPDEAALKQAVHEWYMLAGYKHEISERDATEEDRNRVKNRLLTIIAQWKEARHGR